MSLAFSIVAGGILDTLKTKTDAVFELDAKRSQISVRPSSSVHMFDAHLGFHSKAALMWPPQRPGILSNVTFFECLASACGRLYDTPWVPAAA